MVCNVRNGRTVAFTESARHRESARSRYKRPASGSPVQTNELPATGRPRNSLGTLFACGARRRLMFHFKSSGASAMKSLQHSRRGRMADSGDIPSASTTTVRGCNFTSNSLTTPKLPPPPRKAQYSSGFSLELARARELSAVTSVNPSTLSQDNPNFRVSHPVPPPKISPDAPVCETTPAGKTRPAFWVAVSTDPSKQPPAIHALLPFGSTLTWRILDKSITIPSSQGPKPAKLCPPQRTAARPPVAAAAPTAFSTSLPSAQP